jgi:hypothetical protein
MVGAVVGLLDHELTRVAAVSDDDELPRDVTFDRLAVSPRLAVRRSPSFAQPFDALLAEVAVIGVASSGR